MKTRTVSTRDLNKVSKKYIIDRISWDGYDFPGSRKIDDLFIKTAEGKLQFLMDTFKSEYGWCIEQNGQYKAFEEWIMGMPSCFDVDFYNYQILKIAKEWGSISDEATEREEDKILDNWWNFITVKTFQLFKKHKVV